MLGASGVEAEVTLDGSTGTPLWWAGAYTRPLQSSTGAESHTRKHPTHPKHPLTPHPLNMGYTPPTRTLCPIQSAQVELESGRV